MSIDISMKTNAIQQLEKLADFLVMCLLFEQYFKCFLFCTPVLRVNRVYMLVDSYLGD